MGASPGLLGTARAQLVLPLADLSEYAHGQQPEVMIAKAHEKFDANGNLTDETAKKLIQQLLQIWWTGPGAWGNEHRAAICESRASSHSLIFSSLIFAFPGALKLQHTTADT